MRTQVPVEAVLFDLGGVLIEIDFQRALSHWAKCGGAPLEDLRARFGFDATHDRYQRGEIAARDWFATLRTSLGIDIPDAEFEAGWGSIFVREVPGIRDLLASIGGRLPMYVFSNTNLEHHRIFAPRFADLLRPFRKVFVSNELGKSKPAPEAFHAVAQAMDVAPENILFFDDSRENVAGALAIGMQAVHVASVADVERALASLNDSRSKRF